MPHKTNPRLKLTLSLTLISVILGLMLSMQYQYTRAAAVAAARVQTTDPKAQYVSEQLDKVKQENAQSQQQIENLNKELHDIEKQTGTAGNQVAPGLQDELTKYKIMAGLLPVKGPGVTFTVDDSKDQLPANGDSKAFIFHDSDLRMIVNELFIGGAEALAINDQRITTTTGIMCIGPIVMINGQKVSPPFNFKAVGDTQAMLATLNLKGGVIDVLSGPNSTRDLTITPPKASPSVLLPGYAGDFNGLNK